MQPTIKTIASKKLIGKRMSMSLLQDKTGALFGSFMPKRPQIKHTVGNEMILVKSYPVNHFQNFNPANTFEKWASVEVSDHSYVPEDMETFEIPEGLYAVFHYKGLNTDHSIFQYIFAEWIPNSEYALDDRPHFDVMGPKYKNNDPESEEDLYIPIKKK